MFIRAVLFTVLFSAAVAFAADAYDEPQSISPDQLLDASVLPDADFGMAVIEAVDGVSAVVRTTGATFQIDKADSTIRCYQKIAKQRAVSTVSLPSGALQELVLKQKSSGMAIFSNGQTVIRINGDSLIMIKCGKDGVITATLNFVPDYFAEYLGNYNFFDPYGGISFFEHGYHPEGRMYLAKDPVKVQWQWKAGDILWAGISPPKEFNWESSIRDRVVMHGSSVDEHMYPSDMDIAALKKYVNTLYLHNEQMWEHWQLSLVPRNLKEYLRVMRTAHENNMKVVVYASPKMFTKGTSIEKLANPDPHIGPGQFTGSNESIYLEQATRLIRDFETDGLYFDEMYCNRKVLATQYHLCRTARKLVGDKGLLFYHCTEDVLGDRQYGQLSGTTYCPTIHAYFNLLLRGEAQWNRCDPAYSRYILCTYNISNVVSAQCADDRFDFNKEKLNVWFKSANARFFIQWDWFFSGKMNEMINENYLSPLTPELKEKIEPGLLKQVGTLEQFRISLSRMSKE